MPIKSAPTTTLRIGRAAYSDARKDKGKGDDPLFHSEHAGGGRKGGGGKKSSSSPPSCARKGKKGGTDLGKGKEGKEH